MSRKTKLQINVLFSFMLVIAFALSGTLLPYITIKFDFLRALKIIPYSCSPDLILLTLLVISFVGGSNKAALFGLVFGFLSDTLINSPYHASVIVCVLGAYIAGNTINSFSGINIVSALCCSLVPIGLRSIVTLVDMIASGSTNFLDIIIGCILCEYIVNILFFVPVFFAVKYTYALVERLLKWK